MSTYYFIGGAPRTGKSLILQGLIKQKPMLAASTDAIRSVAKALSTSEISPKLHKAGRGTFGSNQYLELLRNKPEQVLAYEIAAAEETWKSVLNFISYYQQDVVDAAFEGYAILPKDLFVQKFDYKAVYFVNLSDQTEIILSHAKANRHDWLHEYDDDVIKAFCVSNRELNQYYFDEANKYGMPVVVVGDDFQESIDEAINTLLG